MKKQKDLLQVGRPENVDCPHCGGELRLLAIPAFSSGKAFFTWVCNCDKGLAKPVLVEVDLFTLLSGEEQ